MRDCSERLQRTQGVGQDEAWRTESRGEGQVLQTPLGSEARRVSEWPRQW